MKMFLFYDGYGHEYDTIIIDNYKRVRCTRVFVIFEKRYYFTILLLYCKIVGLCTSISILINNDTLKVRACETRRNQKLKMRFVLSKIT